MRAIALGIGIALAIGAIGCGPQPAAAPSFGSFTPEPRTSAPVTASPSPSPSPLLGDAVAAAVRASGQPVADVVVFTAETDPNNLLGRPGQYIAKVSWRDTRVTSTTDLATIEVFADAASMQARYAYLDAIIKSSPLFLQWMYRNDPRLAILRLPKQLTPAQASAWEEWFRTI